MNKMGVLTRNETRMEFVKCGHVIVGLGPKLKDLVVGGNSI